MGLQFRLSFEKVRYGDRLQGFNAKWTPGAGWERLDADESEVLGFLLQGKSVRSVSEELGVSFRQVHAIRTKAEEAGTQFPESKAGRPRKPRN
jgi:hypothetical protein